MIKISVNASLLPRALRSIIAYAILHLIVLSLMMNSSQSAEQITRNSADEQSGNITLNSFGEAVKSSTEKEGQKDEFLEKVKQDEPFQLTEAQTKKYLWKLTDQIDANHDEKIDRTELINWIVKTLKTKDQEEAIQHLKSLDRNNDNKLSWEEYLKHTFVISVEALDKLARENSSENNRDFIKAILLNKKKFEYADIDKDGFLTEEEFTAFLFPRNFHHMIPFELDLAMSSMNKNNDSFIDFDEFIHGNFHDSELTKEENVTFTLLDVDKNGKLDRQEMMQWLSSGYKGAAQQDAEDIFFHTDKNKDNVLTRDEIINSHSAWSGSSATNFGLHLDEIHRDEL